MIILKFWCSTLTLEPSKTVLIDCLLPSVSRLYISLNARMIGERRMIGQGLEGSGCDLLEVFAWGRLRKHTTYLKTTCVLAEIRTD
jgi:hypothetical protein